MIVTETLLGLGQPKTGSTTRTKGFAPIIGADVALRHGGVVYQGHAPLRTIPVEAIGGRTVVATVRNPWDWYVSVYRYIEVYNRRAGRDVSGWGRGNPSWEATLYGMTHPWEVTDPIPAHEILAPGGLEPGAWREGLWSYSTRWFNAGADVWVDCSRQNEAWGILVPEHAESLLACKRWNVQGDSDWPWTPEQLAWVREADGALLATFGYVGPGTPARRILMRLKE